MIKQVIIKDIEIDGMEENYVAKNIKGKILKVLFEPKEGLLPKLTLKIFTKEGEEVLNVDEGGVYYPRSNVSSQKMLIDSFSMSGDKIDYYYFNKGLLFNLSTNSPIEKEVVINKIILIYDDC